MKKKAVAVILIGVLILVIYFILTIPGKSLTDEEKTKALTAILGRKPNLTDSTPKGNKTYKDKYVSFLYPAAASAYNYRDPNIKDDPSVLAIFSFDITNPRLIFNYSVISYTNTVTKVSDIPDARLRQIENNSYTQNSALADGNEGLVFQKKDAISGIEKSAYFFVNGKAYSFSIQGYDQKEVDNLYKTILSSTKFL